MKNNLLQWCLIVFTSLTSIVLLSAPMNANSTITVNTTNDGITNDGLCTLREAIIAANTDSTVGGCASGSGVDIITFDPSLPQPVVFVLSKAGINENSAQTGDLDIAGTLTIRGAGAASDGLVIFDGNGTDRVLEILSGANVTVSGVLIRNGNPGTAADGGGVLVNLTARLTLSQTHVISNTALNGGGAKVLGRLTLHDSVVANNHGGGITNDGGLLTLNNTEVVGNGGGYGVRNQNLGALMLQGGQVSKNQGGGIYNERSTANLTDVRITNNLDGGGIRNTGEILTRLTLRQSQIVSNTATNGGGLLNQGVGARADVINTQISSNTVTTAGGGIFNNGILTIEASTLDHNVARSGGGIHHVGGSLHLTNSTVSHNDASDNGGGLYNEADSIVTNTSLAHNEAAGTGGNIFNDEAQLSISNTIVAFAIAGGNCANSAGTLRSLGHNLENAASCNFTATGDMINTDPRLGSLAENGGHTLTHALLPGSPAIDAGNNATCPATDQRGMMRPQGSACDIGAYEAGIDDEPPGPVGNLRATAVTAYGAQLSWDPAVDNLGVAGYRILAQQDGAGQNAVLLAEVGATSTAYTVTTLEPNRGYSLWALAFDGAGNVGTLADITPIHITTLPAIGTIQFTIEPARPSTSDPISITVSGIHASRCIPQYGSHQITDHQIVIQSVAATEPFCLPAEFPWRYTVGIDPLAASLYTVTHTFAQQVDMITFTVTSAVTPTMTPTATLLPTVTPLPTHSPTPEGHLTPIPAVTPVSPVPTPVPPFPPSLQRRLSPLEAIVGERFVYAVQVTGNPSPTFALVDGPPGMTIDTATGRIDWLPAAVSSKAVPVTVRATNNQGSDELTFTVVVYAERMRPRNFFPFILGRQ